MHEVGLVKRAEGTEIYAPEREETLLRALTAKNAKLKGRLPENSIRAIYREIMSASLALEKDLTIAYFGPEATNTHQAARSKFGASVSYTPRVSIADVFDVVARGNADYGVVPIENSTEGAVNHTLDVFMESDLRICAQILMKIENHLVAKIPRDQIRRIYSHPQVLGQCRNWLRQHLPNVDLVEVSSTPRAAELAATEEGAAAITGTMAAEVHGLQCARPVDSGHRDEYHALFGHRPHRLSAHRRRPHVDHVLRAGQTRRALPRAGTLQPAEDQHEQDREPPLESCKALGDAFSSSISMATPAKPTIKLAIEELEKHCTFVKILGTYPKTSPT